LRFWSLLDAAAFARPPPAGRQQDRVRTRRPGGRGRPARWPAPTCANPAGPSRGRLMPWCAWWYAIPMPG